MAYPCGGDRIAGLVVRGSVGWDGNVRVSGDLRVYERFTSATTQEMVEQPGPVAERLVGRFLRAIGAEGLADVRAALD